jgi:hypothetical protein
VDERLDILGPMEDSIDDSRSPSHTRHTIIQIIRQRVFQIAAGYEDCNDADHLRIDPVLRLAIGKERDPGAGQSMLSRLENDIAGNEAGLAGEEVRRSMEWLIRRLIKVRAKVSYHSREWHVHVTSVSPGPSLPGGAWLWLDGSSFSRKIYT